MLQMLGSAYALPPCPVQQQQLLTTAPARGATARHCPKRTSERTPTSPHSGDAINGCSAGAPQLPRRRAPTVRKGGYGLERERMGPLPRPSLLFAEKAAARGASRAYVD